MSSSPKPTPTDLIQTLAELGGDPADLINPRLRRYTPRWSRGLWKLAYPELRLEFVICRWGGGWTLSTSDETDPVGRQIGAGLFAVEFSTRRQVIDVLSARLAKWLQTNSGRAWLLVAEEEVR